MRPETDLEKALYQCDLMRDEFIRISHLTDSSEIQGMCERAQIRLKSEIPFFDQLEKLESKARKYDALIASKDGELALTTQKVFTNLLRSPSIDCKKLEAVRNLTKQAYFIAMEYHRTLNELEAE